MYVVGLDSTASTVPYINIIWYDVYCRHNNLYSCCMRLQLCSAKSGVDGKHLPLVDGIMHVKAAKNSHYF